MQKNRDTIDAITPLVKLPEADVRFFRSLRGPLRVLVVSEDWCPDCALNVPILMMIAETNSAFEVRFLGRDDNLDLLEFARKGQRKAIPTFFFFDERWSEVGHWVERPARADAFLLEWDHTHAAPDEADRTAEVWREFRRERGAYRDELFLQHGLWLDTVGELRRILSREIFSNVESEPVVEQPA
jgi:hypothetical protein